MTEKNWTPEEEELWDRFEAVVKENEHLDAVIQVLSAPDQVAEGERLRSRARGLEARVHQLEATAREAQKQVAYQERVLSQLADSLKVEKRSQILSAVKALTA